MKDGNSVIAGLKEEVKLLKEGIKHGDAVITGLKDELELLKEVLKHLVHDVLGSCLVAR